MKVLVDTCVILDALQSRFPFCLDAEELVLYAATERIKAFVSEKSVTDIYYLLHNCLHNDRKTREIISKFLEIFEIADTYGIDCQKALLSDVHDYEDGVMIETAKRMNMDCIVTRNIKDFSDSSIAVYTPQIINELISKETKPSYFSEEGSNYEFDESKKD